MPDRQWGWIWRSFVDLWPNQSINLNEFSRSVSLVQNHNLCLTFVDRLTHHYRSSLVLFVFDFQEFIQVRVTRIRLFRALKNKALEIILKYDATYSWISLLQNRSDFAFSVKPKNKCEIIVKSVIAAKYLTATKQPCVYHVRFRPQTTSRNCE